jgi:hypothetical protein
VSLSSLSPLVLAVGLGAATALSACVPPSGGGGGHKPGFDSGNSTGSGGSKGAPGPVAGAGLTLLLAAGAYVLARRRRSKSD